MARPPDIDLSKLSDDAKAIAGCWFGIMKPNSSSNLTLELVSQKPAPRTQIALDQLVEHNFVSVRPLNSKGGLVYTPLVNCAPAFAWFMQHADRDDLRFPLMVRI